MKPVVLVLGARAPVAIDIARAFSAADCEVHLADSVSAWAARWSRVARARVHRLPPARFAFDAYAKQLAELIQGIGASFVVPTCEEVFFASAAAQRESFERVIFAPPLDTLRSLHSKIRFAQLARSLGIPAPETWEIKNRAELEALSIAPDELVLKPEYSRFGTATLLRPDPAAISAMRFTPGFSWAAQRFVLGEEVCLWSAAIKGQIVASAAYRPRWRLGHAASYAFESLENPAVIQIAKTIAAATGMTGHLSFDIILTPSGQVVPIECNPRAVSGVHLFDGRGDLARALLGQIPSARASTGLRFLSPAMLLFGVPHAIIGGCLSEWVNDWQRGADVLGREGDLLPVAGALVDAFQFALTGVTRFRSASGQSTDDIEWNGQPL